MSHALRSLGFSHGSRRALSLALQNRANTGMDPDAVRHHDKAIEDFSPSEGPGPHSTGIKPPAGVFKTSSGARAQFEPINSYHCNSQSTQRRAALGRRGDCEGRLGRSGAPTGGDLKTQGRCGNVTADEEDGARGRRPDRARAQG